MKKISKEQFLKQREKTSKTTSRKGVFRSKLSKTLSELNVDEAVRLTTKDISELSPTSIRSTIAYRAKYIGIKVRVTEDRKGNFFVLRIK